MSSLQISVIGHINCISIIFGSKVTNVTFVSGGQLGNMQIRYLPPPGIIGELFG